MKIIAILQARVSSTRLPNKVLKPIIGKAMLARQIERLACCTMFSSLIVATSDLPEDKAIVDLCRKLSIDTFTGDLNNVLDRFYQAAKKNEADVVIRLTGDCPLIDPNVVDQVIQLHLDEKNDYTSNVAPATFPDGLDVEVINFSVLTQAWHEAKKITDLEHVTLYIRENMAIKKGNLEHKDGLSNYRWTVDQQEDLDLVERIYLGLYDKIPNFNLNDILQYLNEHPELTQINQKISRNEGLLKLLKAEQRK